MSLCHSIRRESGSDCFNGVRAGPASERRLRSPGGSPLRFGRRFSHLPPLVGATDSSSPRVKSAGRTSRRRPCVIRNWDLESKGRRSRSAVTCLTSGCRGVRGARVDFWQADEHGAYDDTGVRLRSHQFTDARGHYWLQTILPGPYANRTRHLHVTVRARGERTVTTMLYFPGVALNAHDPFIDRRLIVRLRIANHHFLARFDFVLGRG